MAMARDNGLTEHERFEELCVLSASGELTPAETEQLDQHLAVCAECRQNLSGYRQFVPAGMAYLAAELTEPGVVDEEAARSPLGVRPPVTSEEVDRGFLALPSLAQQRWIAFSSASLLVIALVALGAYRKGHQAGRNESAAATNQALSDQLKSAIAERDQIYITLQQRSNRIDDLTAKVKEQRDELARLREVDNERQAQYDALGATDQAKSSQLVSISSERNSVASKLRDAEQTLAIVNAELASVKEERQQDVLRASSFESQVRDLSARLKEQDQTVQTQQKFLASDRDIRDLMGARQLYIADVFDVSSDSRKRKPYGRVFYTRGKSLIFYAFDLDRQPGVKNAGEFQLWGKNESRPDQPVSLGVLYVDSDINRRWAMRCDDPEQLAAIDAVFVTVEPNGHGNKPTGKPFLYASLRKEPNHP